jgi:protocatechuate 3,4-dioxygenase, alpha subunit
MPLGLYAHPADQRGANVRFKGFGRCGTGTDPEQAPHVNVILFMRGMLSHVYTRIYFADEVEANANDPVLASVEAARRRTLIAARATTPAGTVYRFDLRMQGPDETVFFDV